MNKISPPEGAQVSPVATSGTSVRSATSDPWCRAPMCDSTLAASTVVLLSMSIATSFETLRSTVAGCKAPLVRPIPLFEALYLSKRDVLIGFWPKGIGVANQKPKVGLVRP